MKDIERTRNRFVFKVSYLLYSIIINLIIHEIFDLCPFVSGIAIEQVSLEFLFNYVIFDINKN